MNSTRQESAVWEAWGRCIVFFGDRVAIEDRKRIRMGQPKRMRRATVAAVSVDSLVVGHLVAREDDNRARYFTLEEMKLTEILSWIR